MNIRTDLALDVTQNLKEISSIKGLRQKISDIGDFHITKISIKNEIASKKIGKPIGDFITFEMKRDFSTPNDNLEENVETLAKEISTFYHINDNVLVIGLGNNDITPDALGTKVARQIFATRHIRNAMPEFEEFKDLKSVSSIAPGVLGQTGIEVAEIVKAICDKTKPNLVIVIDALACSDISRLGNTIQITNTGISPGSGVHNSRKEISKNTLSVPVIAIGVPTVIDLNTIVQNMCGKQLDKKYSQMMVTLGSVDKLIDNSAQLISLALNKAFQPDMSLEEISSLI